MTPPNTEITPSRHTPRELLQECLESAVRVAFIRNDLEIDSDLEMTQQEVANDAACACFGEETESDEPIAEVSIALNRLEAFNDMLSALKAYMFCEQTRGGANPHEPGTNKYRAFELGKAAIAKAEKQP